MARAHGRAIASTCGWVAMVIPMRRSDLVQAIAREWPAGDYRGIITPALCTCDLCLICN